MVSPYKQISVYMHKSGRTLHICLANVRKFRFNDVMHYITTIKGVSSNEKKEKSPGTILSGPGLCTIPSRHNAT